MCKDDSINNFTSSKGEAFQFPPLLLLFLKGPGSLVLRCTLFIYKKILHKYAADSQFVLVDIQGYLPMQT